MAFIDRAASHLGALSRMVSTSRPGSEERARALAACMHYSKSCHRKLGDAGWFLGPSLMQWLQSFDEDSIKAAELSDKATPDRHVIIPTHEIGQAQRKHLVDASTIIARAAILQNHGPVPVQPHQEPPPIPEPPPPPPPPPEPTLEELVGKNDEDGVTKRLTETTIVHDVEVANDRAAQALYDNLWKQACANCSDDLMYVLVKFAPKYMASQLRSIIEHIVSGVFLSDNAPARTDMDNACLLFTYMINAITQATRLDDVSLNVVKLACREQAVVCQEAGHEAACKKLHELANIIFQECCRRAEEKKKRDDDSSSSSGEVAAKKKKVQ